MKLETGKDGVTKVIDVSRHGSAAAGGVVVGSEVVSVAGCTLERGQGQDGLIPLTAICGVATVEFRFRRPNNAASKTAVWREFDEYAGMQPGEVLLTIEYSAGHLHARYEWAAAQVREAGLSLGLAFQAVDDLLDITGSTEELGKDAHHDSEQGKVTWVTLKGEEGARQLAREHTERARASLEGLGGNADFLLELTDFMLERKH